MTVNPFNEETSHTQLANKVAIITGAASGFGAETAREFVAEGARVIVADINENGVQAVASVNIDYRPVDTYTLTDEIQYLPPKERVY